jgi:hypothetical protein
MSALKKPIIPVISDFWGKRLGGVVSELLKSSPRFLVKSPLLLGVCY